MAKVIYVGDDGKEKIVRKGNVIESDIFFRNDYISTKLWSVDDIAQQMFEKFDIEPSKKNVEKVLETGLLKYLDDCTDADWEIVNTAIYACEKDGIIEKNPKTVEGICGIHEHIRQFAHEGSFNEYSFVMSGENEEDDGRRDISAAIEDTLHRLLENGATEEDILRELGASKNIPDEGYECQHYIDLGYIIPGQLMLI